MLTNPNALSRAAASSPARHRLSRKERSTAVPSCHGNATASHVSTRGSGGYNHDVLHNPRPVVRLDMPTIHGEGGLSFRVIPERPSSGPCARMVTSKSNIYLTEIGGGSRCCG